MSAAWPGGKGTMMRTGRSGQVRPGPGRCASVQPAQTLRGTCDRVEHATSRLDQGFAGRIGARLPPEGSRWSPEQSRDRGAAGRRHRHRGHRGHARRCWSRWRAGTASASPPRRLPAGAFHYQATGDALPTSTFDAAPKRPTPSCSAPWAGPASATPTAPRSRRSSTCASGSTSTPACGRSAPSPACRSRWPIRARATSTSSSCARAPRACSTPAAAACVTRGHGRGDAAHHPRRHRAPVALRLPPGRAARANGSAARGA